MALKKAIQYPQGYIADYWKIIGTNIDYLEKKTDITFAVYLNEEVRRGDSIPVDFKIFKVSHQDILEPTREELYTLIKNYEPKEGDSFGVNDPTILKDAIDV